MKNAEDRADYNRFLDEAGLTPFLMQEAADNMPMPFPSPEILLATSEIHGRGVFAKTSLNNNEVIALAKIGEAWTEAGRFANHSARPNAKMVWCNLGVNFVAVSPVSAGEEITVNYRSARNFLDQSEGAADCSMSRSFS